VCKLLSYDCEDSCITFVVNTDFETMIINTNSFNKNYVNKYWFAYVINKIVKSLLEDISGILPIFKLRDGVYFNIAKLIYGDTIEFKKYFYRQHPNIEYFTINSNSDYRLENVYDYRENSENSHLFELQNMIDKDCNIIAKNSIIKRLLDERAEMYPNEDVDIRTILLLYITGNIDSIYTEI